MTLANLLTLILFFNPPSPASFTYSIPDARGNMSAEFVTGVIQTAAYVDGYRELSFVFPINFNAEICNVRTFIGFGRGWIGEAGNEVNVSSYRLYERSEHKETVRNYDAWDYRKTSFLVSPGKEVHFQVHYNQLDYNYFTNAGAGEVNFSLRMTFNLNNDCR